jgi:hypothetical protein
MPYIPESSKYLEFISLRWKEPYYDKFQYHKLQEGYFSVQGRFCTDSNLKKSDPLFSSKWPSKTSGCSSVSNISLDVVAIPSRLPLVSRSFEQSKVASVRTSWQHVWTLLWVREDSSVSVHPSERRGNTVRTPTKVRGELGFPLQTRIWEDSCIRPDDRATPSRRGPW